MGTGVAWGLMGLGSAAAVGPELDMPSPPAPGESC